MMNVMETGEREAHAKDVVRLTFELTGRLRAHFERVAAAVDLTPMQARALFVTRDPVPMGHLADTLHCDASNVTGIVDRLESRGLMTREVDPEDRRRRRLVVTEDGRALADELQARVATDHPLLDLGDADLAALHRILSSLGTGEDRMAPRT